MSKLKAAALRALRTTAQAALAAIPTTAAVLGDIDWGLVGSSAALAGILSLLTSAATDLPEATA